MALTEHDRLELVGSRARALTRSAAGALAVILVVIGVGHGVPGVALAAAGYLIAVALLTVAADAVHRRRATVAAVRPRPALRLMRRYAPGPDGAC